MEYSLDVLHLTEQFEGCRLIAYPDPATGAEPYTLGFGHTAGVKPGDQITQAQAEQFLQEDVACCAAEINRHIGVTLTQNEFNACVDFAFNLGCHNLETSSLWRYIQAGEFDKAAAEFPKWDRAGGHEMAGLLRRRLAEQAEFTS